MPKSAYRPTKVRKKTREVVDYHRDDSQPGKPLHLLVPGAMIAIASLLTIVAVIYQTWFDKSLSENVGIGWLWVLAPVYVGGVFLFCYGYELYVLENALWLTAVIVFSTVAVVLIVAVIAVLLGGGGSSSSSSGDSSSGGKKKGSSSGDSSGPGVSDLLVGSTRSTSSNQGYTSHVSTSRGNSSNLAADIGEVVVNALLTSDSSTTSFGSSTSEAEVRPDPAVCEFCGSTFVPEEMNFTCPKCGAGYRDADVNDVEEGA